MISGSSARLVYRGLEGCKLIGLSLIGDKSQGIHEEVRFEGCKNGCRDVVDCEDYFVVSVMKTDDHLHVP